MMSDGKDPNVEFIPVELINVLNPRSRNRKVFQDIVSSIAKVGLKRPITVARRETSDGVHELLPVWWTPSLGVLLRSEGFDGTTIV